MRGVLSRGLSATVISTLESDAFQVAILVRLELNTNYHLGTAQQSIVYDSNTYTSSGVFLNLADIQEEAQFNTGQIKIRLGNASQTITNDLITHGHIDKTVKIYIALINASAAVIDAPFQIFQGTINAMNIKESPEKSIVSLSVANHWAYLNQHSGRTLTDASQQRFFNGDLTFKFSNQTGKQIVWGTSPFTPRHVITIGGGRPRDNMGRG